MDNIGIEEYLVNNLNVYIGKSDRYLKGHFCINKKTNKSSWVELTYRMLGVSSNKTQELIDNDIIVKTIRINKNGKIKENMSFPTINFNELVQENWKGSYIHEYFESTKFLFMVFKETYHDYVFLGGTFWEMPVADLEDIVSKEWEEIQSIIARGISFMIKDGKVSNNLPKKSQTRVIHLRPKASKAAYLLNDGFSVGNIWKDGDQLPNGEWMTKQCFWLNNDYVLEQIEDKSSFVKYNNSESTLSNMEFKLLKQRMIKKFYTIGELKNIFRETLNSEDDKHINAYNLKKLGYMFNYTYAYSGEFDSLKHYIGSIVMSADLVDLIIDEPSLCEINDYDEVMDSLIKEYPVFRVEEGVFVKATKLFKGGISRNDIKGFIDYINNKYDTSYFSVQSLRDEVLLSEMFSHGFEDCLYEDMILTSSSFVSFNVSGTRVFCRPPRKNTLSGLLIDILTQKKRMYIYDLKEFLDTSFGTNVDLKILKSASRFSDLYFNQDNEKVYINHETFIEDIKHN